MSDLYSGEVIIRIPLIPGFNGNINEINIIADFLKGIEFKSVELLPYHQMSEHEYRVLDMPFTTYPLPDSNEIEEYKKILRILN